MTRHHFILAACVSITAALSTGCAGKATIYTTSGERIQGTIEGTNEVYMYVDQGAPDMLKIERSRVLGINHPGRALILIGAMSSLVYMPGAVAESWGSFDAARAGADISPAEMILSPFNVTTALAIGLLALGAYKWRRSVDASFHPLDVDFVYPPPEAEERAESASGRVLTPPPSAPSTTSWTSFQAVHR